MSQIVLYILHSTVVLSFYIDVVLSLSIWISNHQQLWFSIDNGNMKAAHHWPSVSWNPPMSMVDSPHKRPVMWKMLSCHDVIMISLTTVDVCMVCLTNLMLSYTKASQFNCNLYDWHKFPTQIGSHWFLMNISVRHKMLCNAFYFCFNSQFSNNDINYPSTYWVNLAVII